MISPVCAWARRGGHRGAAEVFTVPAVAVLRCFYRGVSAKFTACWAGVLAPAGLSGGVSRSFAALVRRARTDGLPVWWRCVAVGQHLAGMLTRAALVAI